MPTLDDMFGKPKAVSAEAPKDILPSEAAKRTGGSFDKGAGRDVLLAASPFSPVAKDFFNKDAEELTLTAEQQRPGPFPQLPGSLGEPIAYSGNPAVVSPNDRAVQSGVDSLTQALGPSIDNISRFGEFGGGVGPSSELSISQLREALRAVLKRL